MPDADYCARLVHEADKDRFLAALFAPAAHRDALYALYAFNVEIMRVREVVREPLAGEVRLQWWTDALSGARAEEAQSNPVAAALIKAIAGYGLPVQPLLELIEARISDLYDDPIATVSDLEDYAARTSSSLITLAAQILGEGAAPATGLTRHAGISYALGFLLRALPVHAARGKLYLPVEVMERHGARREDALAGQATSELRAVLAELRLRARWHLRAANAMIGNAPSAVILALLPVAPTAAILTRMERSNYQPFLPPEVPQWRRQWLMWRAARRPHRLAG
jgi:phytoene synthase